MLRRSSIISVTFVFLLMALVSCHHDHNYEIHVYQKGNLELDMAHLVSGYSLELDTMIYTTSLGHYYMVNDVQYFLSGIALHQKDGEWITVHGDEGIHYFDERIPATCKWKVGQQFPAGVYDSIGFTFGLDQVENYSGHFPNPPERDMFWPDILGGGYHYMKMNLKWKDDMMQESMPFMFHIGIGQIYSGTTSSTDSIIGFIQNYFPVRLPASVTIGAGQTSFVTVGMMVESWFDGQNAFDFSRYSMGIMQSQEGMYKACMNGRHAFAVALVINIGSR
jgi:hypothetical protein